MYVEVFGVDVEVEELAKMKEEVKIKWNEMDKEEKEVYDDYEEFEECELHQMFYSDDEE